MPVDSQHPEYVAMRPVWKQCRDCVAGERAVKAAKTDYLAKLSGHVGADGERAYEAYLKRAMFYPATERTVVGLMGAILRKPPAVEAPEAIEAQLEDVTLTGRSFIGFTIDVLEELFRVGRGGILVDLPKDGGQKARPYWVRFSAEQIINWRTEAITLADGTTQSRLTLLVLEEHVPNPDASDRFKTETTCQYRVLELIENRYTVTIWTKAKDAKEWTPGESVQPTRRGVPFDEIPFTFYGPRDTDASVDKPPMEDLTNVNLSHFQTSADLETGAHYTAIPTPWVAGVRDGQGSFMIGATTAWRFDDPQAKAGFLEFTGQGLNALEKRSEVKQHLMAVIGAKLLEGQPSKQETAAAVRMRHSGEHATLTTIAVAVSEALTQVLRWHVWWAGLDVDDDEVTIQLNQEFFDAPLTPQEATALTTMWIAGGISPETYYWNLQRGGVARPGVTFEQEKEAGAFPDDPTPEPEPDDEEDDEPPDPNADRDDENVEGGAARRSAA